MRRYVLGILALAATAAAQQATQMTIRVDDKVVQEKAMLDKIHVESTGASPARGPMMVHFDGAHSAVKGSPYSAEAATETVQVLADGNRIVSKSSNKTYRDSEGRTRVELTPGPTGAWMPDTKQFSMTMIDDPVSGEHITLNNVIKQATRFSFKEAGVTSAGSASGARTFATTIVRSSGDASVPPPPLPPPPPVPATGRGNVGYVRSGPTTNVQVNSFFASVSPDIKPDTKSEPLGKQVIEGVECTGTRETVTIAAGAIGNDRALETVTEHWYSPDLQQEVLTKTTDPRFGETTYRLTNIVRAEQPRSLFEVPADYKLEDPAVNFKSMRDVKQQ
jgi:hypothetical protein